MNFTRPWNANGVLDFSSDESTVPKYPLKIAGVSPKVISSGLLAQTYSFTIVGVSQQSIAEQVFETIIQLGVSAVAQQATSQHHFEQIHQFGIASLSNSTVSTGDVYNDINVDRGLKSEKLTTSNKPIKLYQDSLAKFNDSPSLQNQHVHPLKNPDYIPSSIIAYQSELPDLDMSLGAVNYDGDSLNHEVVSVNKRLGDADIEINCSILNGAYIGNNAESLYMYPPRADNYLSSKWLQADVMHQQVGGSFSRQGTEIKNTWYSYFEDAINPTGARPIIPDPPIEPPKPIISTLNFIDLWNGKGELDFLRIELDALIIMNTVIMYHTSKLGERTYINPVSWSVSNDLDSYAWSLNCSLYDDGILDLITTDDTFTLEVNDIKWNFNAFKYKRLQDGQFSGYSVTFVSKTQQLGYPSAQPMNVSLDAPKGAVQLVDEILGDIPLVNKGVDEWTLQAGTVEMMQAEPKAIISEILKASGAVMLPSVSGESILIQPRYKVASWLMDELSDAECDVLLDGNYMITDSGEIRNGTEFNAVTISGEKSGVVTKIVREGTGGDTEATDYTTQFHQDHNVGIEYAKKVFSENGTIELAEISVGLDDNLLQSGSIVRIKHASGDRTGVSLGVSVKGDRVENVLQTATIEFRL